MVLHPEVQKQAQAELDKVMGDDSTLPSFNDRSKLPFVTAIVKETLRWIPVLPLGVPHRSINGDDYKGYWIPPGTTIIPNTWFVVVLAIPVLGAHFLLGQSYTTHPCMKILPSLTQRGTSLTQTCPTPHKPLVMAAGGSFIPLVRLIS